MIWANNVRNRNYSKLDFKALSIVIFTVSILTISGTAQNADAGPYNSQVWSAGGIADNDNWSNTDNWFRGTLPDNPSDPNNPIDNTIYIGCSFAPTPTGVPAPTNVNAVLDIDQDVISPNNDGLMLCAGSTLTINAENELLIIPEDPESPITVSHTNAGTLMVIGTFRVQNTAPNDG